MSKNVSRRGFLEKAAGVAAGAAVIREFPHLNLKYGTGSPAGLEAGNAAVFVGRHRDRLSLVEDLPHRWPDLGQLRDVRDGPHEAQ